MRTLSIIFAFYALATATAVAQEGERCAVMVQNGDVVQTTFVPNFTISGATLPLHLPAGYSSVNAIMCGRETLQLKPNDYHVLTDLNVPFYITDGDRTASLEMLNGQLQFRFTQGRMTAAEEQQVQQMLDQMQLEIQGEAPPHD